MAMAFVIVSGVLTLLLAGFAAYRYLDNREGIISGLLAVAMAVVFLVMIVCYGNAKFAANIIYKEYGQSYTVDELFFSSDVVNTIVLGQRTRLDITTTSK